jgi:hypothetical protein
LVRRVRSNSPSQRPVCAFSRYRCCSLRIGGPEAGRTFTDPTVVGGGGISIFVNRHFALRPDVEAVFVLRDGRTHVVTTAALHAVYHFESHPVTPVRVR